MVARRRFASFHYRNSYGNGYGYGYGYGNGYGNGYGMPEIRHKPIGEKCCFDSLSCCCRRSNLR